MKLYDVCEWSCVWTRGKYLVSLRFVSNYTVRKNSRKREHALIQLPNERSGFNLRRRTGSKSEQEERQELTFFFPFVISTAKSHSNELLILRKTKQKLH